MPDTPDDLTRIAADMTLATQTAARCLLEAEMHALARMLSGVPAPLPTDDEVEQGFENMPV